jgi:hypothetical protein
MSGGVPPCSSFGPSQGRMSGVFSAASGPPCSPPQLFVDLVEGAASLLPLVHVPHSAHWLFFFLTGERQGVGVEGCSCQHRKCPEMSG